MSGEAVVFDDFSGGLNNVDSRSAIENTELSEIVNFDLSSTGTLFGRPPITAIANSPVATGSTITNFITNPSLDVSAAGYSALSASNVYGNLNPDPGYSGKNFYRTIVTGVISPEKMGIRYRQTGIVAGRVYSYGGWFRASQTRAFYIRIVWMNTNGGVINLGAGDFTTIPYNTWTRVSAPNVQAPPGAVSADIDIVGVPGDSTDPDGFGVQPFGSSIFGGNTNWVVGDTLDADAYLLVEGTALPPYFDGGVITPGKTNSWTGTPGLSTSQQFDPVGGAGEPLDMLGYFTDDTGAISGVFATKDKTWLLNPLTNTWTECAPFAASDCVQYQSKLYLVSPQFQGGYYARASSTQPYAYFSLATSATNSKPMPRGSSIALYQERFWIAGPRGTVDESTLFFSNITSTSAGTNINEFTGDFIGVQSGDGQRIEKLIVGQNDLFIFRNRSTWRFIYDSTPAQGRLTPISNFVGADSKYCVAVRENYIVTLSGGSLYELVSYVFYPLNLPKKMRFTPSADVNTRTIDYAVSMLGNRALVWSRGATYVFDVSLRAWTMWDSPATRGAYFLRYPGGNDRFGGDTAFGVSGSSGSGYNKVYRVIDAITPANAEEMTCSITTKAYDYGDPGATKRMWWWGVNGATGRNMRGKAIPLGLSDETTTWDAMDQVSWDQLSKGSWDYPLIPSPSIDTDRAFPAAVPAQIFAKMNQGIRFRQCSFTVSLDTNGSTSSGPVRIDSITTWVETKTKVSKAVS